MQTTQYKEGPRARRAAAPLLALTLGLGSQGACATESTAPGKPAEAPPASALDTDGVFLVCEAAAGLNGAMASANPKIYGGVLVVMAPFMFGDGMARGDPGASAGFGMLEATGIYDLTAYDHDYDRGRVFRENVLALNLTVATVLVVDYFGEDSKVGKVAKHVSFTPLPQGGMLVGYRWRF